MCTGIPVQDPSSTTQSPVSCQISEPRRISGPRLLPVHQACSEGLVGLAIVAAIQGELEMTTSSGRPVPRHPTNPTNHQMPRHSASSSADQQRPRHSTAANQQMPRQSIAEQKPRHCIGKSKGPPSIFTIATPSCLNASAPQFSTLCFLCKRPLPSNKDIYMYRGDQAFCSQQCRYHQMAVDETKEKLCSRTCTFAPTSCTTAPNYYKHKERIFAYAKTTCQSQAFFYANIVNF